MNKTYRWIVFGSCWLIGVFAGMDSNLFSVVMQQTLIGIVGSPTPSEVIRWGSYIFSSFLLGWMLGGILMGLASDYLGRVKTLALSVLCYALFTGLAAQTDSVWTLVLSRFGTGLGVGGSMLGISIFIAESWANSSRAVAIGALITSYQVGVLLSGIVSHLFSDWRSAFMVGSTPALLALVVVWLFREPQVWKDQKKDELKERSNFKNLFIGGTIFGSLLIGYWASLSWIPTWIQNLLGTAALGQEKNWATVIHGFCAIAGCLAAGPLADIYGRRPIIFLSLAGAFLDSLWMFLGHREFSEALYVYHGMLGFFVGMAQAVMYIYLPELFSTKTRASSVGICLNAGRLVTSVAILFMGVIVNWLGGYVVALSLFSLIYLIGIVMTFAAPETKAQLLKD